MANLIDNSKIEYTVKHEAGWFIKSMKKAKTLEKDYLRVIPNVTKKVLLKKAVIANNTISQVDNRNCEWTPSQRINLDSKTFNVQNFKINEEQCMNELDNIYSENVFNGMGGEAGANKTAMPNADGLEDTLMLMIQNALAGDIDRIIWGGEGNEVDGVQNGLVDKALASGETIKVANAITIDTSNVLSEIQRVYDSIPDEVINEGEFDPEKAPVRIFVDLKTYRYAKQALSSVPTERQVVLPSWTFDNGVIRYMGVEIALVSYLPSNTMIAASRDNLFFATDLLADTQSIKAERGNSLKDENMWYVKGQYRAESFFLFDDEVVVYSKK